MIDDITAAIRTAEQARCAAMLANDGAALEALLDDRLQFHHASGTVDDKPAYIAKIGGGRIRYSGIAWAEERVTALAPDVALLTGKMVTDVQVDGVDKRLNNRVITVWHHSDGGWCMVAFQSTPMAA
jgi:hypothetical protein